MQAQPRIDHLYTTPTIHLTLNEVPTLFTRSSASKSPFKSLTTHQNPRFCPPLQREQSNMLEQAIRVARACEDHHVDTNNGRGALSSLLMHRSIRQVCTKPRFSRVSVRFSVRFPVDLSAVWPCFHHRHSSSTSQTRVPHLHALDLRPNHPANH